MNIVKFWELIDETAEMSKGNVDQQIKLLFGRLLELEEKQLVEFKRIFNDMRQLTYRPDLWDACILIQCGCSEGNFIGEFSGWLVAQGRTVFENTICDPEFLVTIIDVENRDNVIDGRLTDVVTEVYEYKTGQEMPIVDWSKPFEDIGEPTPPQNLPQKLPQLFAKFGPCD